MFMWSRVAPLNIVVLIGVDGPSLVPVLPQVLATLQRRHPLLRARVTGGAGRPAFEALHGGAIDPIPLRVLAVDEAPGVPGVIAEEMNTGFDASSGPLIRVTYVRGTGSQDEMVLTLHHCISDAVGTGSLVSEILEGCAAQLSGEDWAPGSLDLPPAMPSLLPRRHRGLSGVRRALAFVGGELADELRYRRGTMGMRRGVPSSGRAASRTVRLSTEETTELVSWSRRRRLTLTSVLNAALLLEAGARLYDDRPCAMRAVVWVDLRPHLSPPPAPETLGGYHSMVRFVVRVDRRNGFELLARTVQDLASQRVDRGDRFAAAVLSPGVARAVMRTSSQRMGTTALSYGGAQHIRRRYGPIDVREVQGFISNSPRGAEVAATAGVSRGSLWCNLLYVDSELDAATVGAIESGLAARLVEASRS